MKEKKTSARRQLLNVALFAYIRKSGIFGIQRRVYVDKEIGEYVYEDAYSPKYIQKYISENFTVVRYVKVEHIGDNPTYHVISVDNRVDETDFFNGLADIVKINNFDRYMDE